MCLSVRFNVYGLSHKSEIFEWSAAKKCCSSVVTGDLIIWYSVIIDLHTIVHISHVHPCRFSADNSVVDAANRTRGLSHSLATQLNSILKLSFLLNVFLAARKETAKKEPSNGRIVSLWKFIGLFSWSFWGGGGGDGFPLRCTFIQFTLHFSRYYSSRWQIRPLQTIVTGKKFQHKHKHTHINIYSPNGSFNSLFFSHRYSFRNQ